MSFTRSFHLRILVSSCALLVATGSLVADVDFARDVRPILAARCVKCHGGVRAKSGVSFVRRESAFAPARSGRVPVTPGSPENSELLARISSVDEDRRMPPDGPLRSAEIEVLREWIETGAPWPTHWAFEPPAPHDGESIDSLVAAGLRRAGVTPSPQAPRTTLIRRLSLDLLGLPPSPESVDAFVDDDRADAYERLVDSLLASPHFGERWGRHWLDQARYADSDGYEKDNPRPDAWRWRKWVIDAINADLPLDRFTVEQLAGDLLPDASPETRLATAFHRQTLFNREGGVDPEEDRTKRTIDRTNTTAAVWLGLTTECAQCHDHPYDAIAQREFYALYAFFNDADEDTVDVLRAGSEELARLEAELIEVKRAAEPNLARWIDEAQAIASRETPVALHVTSPSSIDSRAGETGFSRLDDGSQLVAADPDAKSDGPDAYVLTLPTEGRTITGLRLDLLTHASLGSEGPGLTGNGNFVLSEVELMLGERRVRIARAEADFSQGGFEVARAIDGDLETGWAIAPEFGRPHHATFSLAEPLETAPDDVLTLTLEQQYAAAKGRSGHRIGRFRVSLHTGGSPFPGLDAELLAALRSGTPDAHARERLADYHFRHLLEPSIRLETAIAAERTARSMRVRVLRARERTTHVFHRGDFLQPEHDAGEVRPDSPACLPALEVPPERRPTRLDLARWIVSEENPLTARVLVNNVWSHLFGEGLVDPPTDLGSRTRRPTQLALLDHLASALRRPVARGGHGWSRKSLIRTIVLSRTYRQDSRHRPELATIDPANTLLHRQNRWRVEGEIVRDVFLSIAGLLEHEIGGPSVFPPVPPDVAALSYANNFQWKTSEGADRYRRGMYTFFKRTAPDPNLLAFDCPDTNVSISQRMRSNTPLMALATLGNEVFHEAAQAFARRVLEDSSPPSEPARVERAFRLAVSRAPSPEELTALCELLETARRWYVDHPEDARSLVEPHPASSASLPLNAAWVATTRVLLNLDETSSRE